MAFPRQIFSIKCLEVFFFPLLPSDCQTTLRESRKPNTLLRTISLKVWLQSHFQSRHRRLKCPSPAYVFQFFSVRRGFVHPNVHNCCYILQFLLPTSCYRHHYSLLGSPPHDLSLKTLCAATLPLDISAVDPVLMRHYLARAQWALPRFSVSH